MPDSPAAKANLRPGDVIEQVNKEPVRDVKDFRQKIEQAKDGDTILLLVRRGEGAYFAALRPDKG
jgi:serine protease Do